MSSRSPDRYPMRAQFTGVLYWTCPRCGKLNSTRLRPACWAIQCRNKRCKRRGTLGLVLYHSARKLRTPGDPPDALIPEALPDHTPDATQGPNPEPMPLVTPRGPRKLFQPVHSVDPEPSDP